MIVSIACSPKACGLSDIMKSDTSASQRQQINKSISIETLMVSTLKIFSSAKAVWRASARHIPKVETVPSQLKAFKIYHLLRFQNSSERILRIFRDSKGVVPKNKEKRCRGRGDRKIMNI